jgi:hypothetical protein
MSLDSSTQGPPHYSRLEALEDVPLAIEAEDAPPSPAKKASSNSVHLHESLRRPASPQGRLHCETPVLMVSTFVAGIVLAISHHIYYTALNGQIFGSAARQQWPLR